MSARFTSTADLLYRNSALGDSIPNQTPLTVCGWMLMHVANNGGSGPLFARFANNTGSERTGLYVGPAGTGVMVEATASSGDWSTEEPFTPSVWQFWAERYSGGLCEVLLDGAVVRSATGTPAADTSAAFVFGCTSTEFINGQLGRWRIWESALTDAEILAEKYATAAVKAGAWADYRMLNSALTTDQSGNGRTLNISGVSDGTSEPPTSGLPLLIMPPVAPPRRRR